MILALDLGTSTGWALWHDGRVESGVSGGTIFHATPPNTTVRATTSGSTGWAMILAVKIKAGPTDTPELVEARMMLSQP